MDVDCATLNDDPSYENAATLPMLAHYPGVNDQMLHGSGWLCGFRVDDMDGPQVTAQVASYVDGATPFMQDVNDVSTETIATHSQRAASYAHHGWSTTALGTVSSWTSSRIDAKSRQKGEGEWITRRTLAQRLRIQVQLEDLAPVPEFATAIVQALERPNTYEKFQAVYRALNRWGDVVPLEMEMGSSLSCTDSETNFNQFPATISYSSLDHLLKLRSAKISRKGPTNNIGWDDGTWIWAAINAPAIEWRPIRILAVAPTISLFADNIQTRLADLHNEQLSYIPPLIIDPINWFCTMHYGTLNASKTISDVRVRCGNHIVALSVNYLDGATLRGGDDVNIEHTFTLTNGL
ncbi:hypothetical protein RSOLAG1IB_10089 [Rhizoctonia solani AG-1 IB]|uniref:MACPF-like domain-containing protein n=1 Tax=Thanatephorus cucumeris (strain AG1-IB / isolate 7/3/14) TaxID=1108050 RepID=A0A0B7FU86_THACB|nr:hypothetical protein RSOLAG1IB_10089 [Rhizoctonia solani AG-1 IB]